jgi:hypothetical protein
MRFYTLIEQTKGKKMELDDIFKKSATHLLKQGKTSSISNLDGICAYRGEDGAMCAIGCLIDDSAYDFVIEGKSVDMPEVEMALRASGINFDDEDNLTFTLLHDLQYLHDETDPKFWLDELHLLSDRYQFKMVEV